MKEMKCLPSNDYLLLFEIEEGLKLKSDEEVIKLCNKAIKRVKNKTIKIKLEGILLLLL